MSLMKKGKLDDLLDQYLELLKQIDIRFEQAIQYHETQVTCFAGCRGCCQGIFEITLLDGLLLYRKLHSKDVLTQGALAQAKKLDHEVTAAGWSYPHSFTDEEEERLGDALMRLDGEPCPLLNRNGQCRMYAYRPSICRFQGIPFVDPTTGAILEDECPLEPPGRHRVDFDLFKFNQEEERIFAKFVELVPELGNRELGDWDTIIPSVVLWGQGRSSSRKR